MDDKREGFGRFYWKKKKDENDKVEEIYLEGNWKNGSLEGEGCFRKGNQEVRGKLERFDQNFQFNIREDDEEIRSQRNSTQREINLL